MNAALYCSINFLCNLLFFLASLNFGVKLTEGGVNDTETCSSNIGLYFNVQNLHNLDL